MFVSHAERTSMLFSEQALRCLLQLLDKEVAEHSRHLVQYFQVFFSYAHKGSFEVMWSLVCSIRGCSIRG